MQVGGVGDRQEQALAAAEYGQDPVLGQQLVVDQPDGLGVEVAGVQIEQRHAELAGGGNGDVAGVGGTTPHQLRDDAAAVLGGIQGIHHGRLFDHAILDQRCGSPPSADRGVAEAKEALSFMNLRDSTRVSSG